MKSTDTKCYSIHFKGEGSADAGGPFRESLTNIADELENGVVPLLIRSPNNRNEHGINRDCFILDSRSKTPAHKMMFKYFGGFLAFAFMTKSPLPFNLAPWLWKQLVHETLTLDDLDGIDTYSAQVLRDLQKYSKTLSDEEFEAGVEQYFTTVISSGEEVPLCPDGENIRVTKENLTDFIDKVLDARRQESAF
jgi:E3 ubiquitin-protein ligase HERC2